MKKIITWILLNTLLIQISGCYSFSEIEKPANQTYTDSLIENYDINIYLNSGSKIFSEAKFHTTYADTAEYIYGIGQIYVGSSSEGKPFVGQIFKSEIDSSSLEKNFLNIWIKNQKKIVFEQKNYKEFAPDSDTGILLIDTGNPEKIPTDDIESIEIGEIDPTLTTLYIVGMIALVSVAIAEIWVVVEIRDF